MISGTQGDYYWIEWSSPSSYLYDFIAVFPEVVLHKYVAVTSCDSGPLVPNDQELQDGWFSENQIAYSPQITDVQAIPNDQFDEWYVFPNLTKLPNIEIFINYAVFSLANPESMFPHWDSARIAARRQEQERFWD